jgi:hypothetical protein
MITCLVVNNYFFLTVIPYLAFGTAVLGAADVPPECPLATLEAAAFGFTPDLTPLDPAFFCTDKLPFKPTLTPDFVAMIISF